VFVLDQSYQLGVKYVPMMDALLRGEKSTQKSQNLSETAVKGQICVIYLITGFIDVVRPVFSTLNEMPFCP